jgi:DNA-directed RNA polymerase subunit RPC12/RpoP
VCEYMCHICAKVFPTQGTLKGHLYSHVAKSEKKQCQECGKWLKSDLTLRVHMRCHSGRLFRCPHCDKVFHHKQTMLDHMRSHSSARPYKCLVCGKTFKLKSGLRTHAVQHTGEKPYQCPHCPRTFTNSGNYYSHKKRMHAKEKLCNLT